MVFFFLFRFVFNSFFTIPVEIENARLKLALKIPKVSPITVANDAIVMPQVVTDKTTSDLWKYSKEVINLLRLLLIISLYLVSTTK